MDWVTLRPYPSFGKARAIKYCIFQAACNPIPHVLLAARPLSLCLVVGKPQGSKIPGPATIPGVQHQHKKWYHGFCA